MNKDCETQGMTVGCDKHCPVLQSGKCPLSLKEQKEILRKKGLTMTREELVKELNKIKGIEARIDGDVLHISGEDICDLQYEYGDLVVCGQIILAENRTPEQILSVVKALVE